MVDNDLRVLPIVDEILKDFHGRMVNSVELGDFTFGKELQLHVMEVKPNAPFRSPETFEENMQAAVLLISDFLRRKRGARLLGTGMHPLLRLEETGIWPHRHRQIYEAFSRLFNLNQHGWLNIQSFQLNLPYSNEQDGVKMHNLLANIIPYLPAFAASSPICEGMFGEDIDNRLHFYQLNQREIPSVTGDIIPEYVNSFSQYRTEIIEKYSSEMARAGADPLLLHKEWINSRGVIFRFDRKALEIRVMDEQECIKSDVAIGCFIRALLRGVFNENLHLLPHEVLVNDLNSIVAEGLNARPSGRSARAVCESLYAVAWKNASQQERKYLPIVRKRIDNGSLSEIIRERVKKKTQKTDFGEAVITVYSKLAESLMDNRPYF
ncbi:MAG: glutamate-cysteine ligase family protein [Candidatus Bathyarchaeia archaeon]